MKKSNVIISALLAVLAGFFLWLWYFLGFNRIDDPLDLVLAIIWWAVIVVAIGVIIKTEQIRRRRIRTVYVGDAATFNSEKGLMSFAAEKPMQDVIASILENLKYDFTREDFPEEEKFQVKYFVRTKEYKAEETAEQDQSAQTADQADAADVVDATVPLDEAAASTKPATSEQKKWKGEVVVVDTKEEHPFDTPEELASILASIDQAAA